jgi:hypothetical protein
MQGERPSRPTNPALTDDVWALMEMCWHQDPRLRPEMRRVLHDLASSLLRSLRQFTESSPEFQVALGQFYDNTERKGYIDLLHDAELKEFINFLDDVRSRLNLSYLNPGYDFSYRCCAPRNRIRIYYRDTARPAGGVRQAGHTSRLPHDSSSIFRVDCRTLRHEQICQSMEGSGKPRGGGKRHNGCVHQGDKNGEASQGR